MGHVGGEANRDGTPIGGGLGGRLTDGRPPDLQPKAPETTTDQGSQEPVNSEARLAEIRSWRRSDPARYWGAEAQAEELRLLSGQGANEAKAPATDAEGETEAAEDSTDEGAAELSPAETKLAKLQEELAEIRSKARALKGAERDALEARERELLAEVEVAEAGLYVGEDVAPALVATWGQQGGVVHHVGVLAGMVRSISGALDDAGRGAFVADLEALPAAVRKLTYEQFSVAGGSLKARLDAIEKGLTGADLAAAQAFRAKHGEALRRGLVG